MLPRYLGVRDERHLSRTARTLDMQTMHWHVLARPESQYRLLGSQQKHPSTQYVRLPTDALPRTLL